MLRRFLPCLLAMFGLLFAPALAHADDGDDTLAFYLSKADLVVVGTLTEFGEGQPGGNDTVFYLGTSVQVEEVLAGECSGPELAIAIVLPEAADQDPAPDLREEAKYIFFLSRDETGLRHWAYRPCDLWFGVTPYSPAMARSLKRLADEQARADETQPWGEAFEGYRCGLRVEAGDDDDPAGGIVLTYVLDNQGDSPQRHAFAPEIEVDGTWYVFDLDYSHTTGEASNMLLPNPATINPGETGEVELTVSSSTAAGVYWFESVQQAGRARLASALTPGQHTIRIRERHYRLGQDGSPSPADSGLARYITSNAVEVVIPEPDDADPAEGDAPWGEALEGYRCGLSVESGEEGDAEGGVVLKYVLDNQGQTPQGYGLPPTPQIEVDGQWYGCTLAYFARGTVVIEPGNNSEVLSLAITDLSIGNNWASQIDNQQSSLAQALTPGQHMVRIRELHSPAEGSQARYITSNAVEVVVPEPGDAEEADEAEKGAKVVGEESTEPEFALKLELSDDAVAHAGDVVLRGRVSVDEGEHTFSLGALPQVVGIYILGPWGVIEPSTGWIHQQHSAAARITITPDEPYAFEVRLADYFPVDDADVFRPGRYQVNLKFYDITLGMNRPLDSGPVLFELPEESAGVTEEDVRAALQALVTLDDQVENWRDLFARLSEASGIDFTIDWDAMGAVGVERENTMDIRAKDLPAQTVLELCLGFANREQEDEAKVWYRVHEGAVEVGKFPAPDIHTPEGDEPVDARAGGNGPAPPKLTNNDIAGLWNDRLVGENTGLDLRPDGTGRIVSLAVTPLEWAFDPETRALTLVTKPEHDHLESYTWELRANATGTELHAVSFTGQPNEHVFYRVAEQAEPNGEQDDAAEEIPVAPQNFEDAQLSPADGSHIRGEFIDLGDDDRLLLRYMPIVDSGVEIERVTDGTVVWRVHAAGLGVAHSRYRHDIRAEVEDGQLILNSYGSGGAFTERRDLATGELLGRSEDNKWGAGEIDRAGAAQEALDAWQREQQAQQEAIENITRQDTAPLEGPEALPQGVSPEQVERRLRDRIAELEAQIEQMRAEVAGLPSRSIVMSLEFQPGDGYGPQEAFDPSEFASPCTPSFDQWPWVDIPEPETVEAEEPDSNNG